VLLSQVAVQVGGCQAAAAQGMCGGQCMRQVQRQSMRCESKNSYKTKQPTAPEVSCQPQGHQHAGVCVARLCSRQTGQR
jgi:hypothetical protein